MLFSYYPEPVELKMMVVRVRTRSGTTPVGCQPKSTGGPIFACYLGTLMCHFMLTPICHHKLFVYKNDPARFSQNKKKKKKVSLVSPNQPFSRQSPGLARKPLRLLKQHMTQAVKSAVSLFLLQWLHVLWWWKFVSYFRIHWLGCGCGLDFPTDSTVNGGGPWAVWR